MVSGTLKIEAEGDGISSGAYMQIENSNIDILAGGGYENATKTSSGGWGGFMGGKGGFGGGGGRPGQTSQTTNTDDSSINN